MARMARWSTAATRAVPPSPCLQAHTRRATHQPALTLTLTVTLTLTLALTLTLTLTSDQRQDGLALTLTLTLTSDQRQDGDDGALPQATRHCRPVAQCYDRQRRLSRRQRVRGRLR